MFFSAVYDGIISLGKRVTAISACKCSLYITLMFQMPTQTSFEFKNPIAITIRTGKLQISTNSSFSFPSLHGLESKEFCKIKQCNWHSSKVNELLQTIFDDAWIVFRFTSKTTWAVEDFWNSYTMLFFWTSTVRFYKCFESEKIFFYQRLDVRC